MKNNFFKQAENSSAKITLKVTVLVVMTLLLWIPLVIIEDITTDRKWREQEVQAEIAAQVGGDANELEFFLTANSSPDNSKEVIKHKILPYQLDICGNLTHTYLKQGRYDILTYTGDVEFNAEVSLEELFKDTVRYGITDPSALYFSVVNSLGYMVFETEVSMDITTHQVIIDSSFTVRGTESFAFRVPGNGSVSITGDWSTPDFASASTMVPLTREVTKEGFTADWKITNSPDIVNAMYQQCGVTFLVPVSQYQMTMRTLKYGLLIIILTFVAFFITELSIKRSINIFQYFLVGLALVIFYSLLLSISEYLRFSYAFSIATAMTLGLIALYLMSVLSARKPALIITSLLALLYLYIYVLTQMETYSLIAGSIGLFIILAVIMFASQRLFNLSAKQIANSDTTATKEIDTK